MKAVRSVAGDVKLVDIAEPTGVGELVALRSASICASDLSYVRWGSEAILGHELAGLREDGTPVLVEALYGCGDCEQCLQGRDNLCATHGQRSLGMFADGGMCEQFRAPANRLFSLPEGLDVRDAALVEPASVAWHALRLAATAPGLRVAVVGGGALGLLAAASARRQGSQDVAVLARHPHQQEAAERVGATVVNSGVYDIVVEAAGSPGAFDQAVELVAPRGIVVSLGVHLGTVPLEWMPLFHKEARLMPSLGYAADVEGGREVEHAARMLADEPEIARALITHRFPLTDAPEAFRVAADRASGAIRVVLEP